MSDQALKPRLHQALLVLLPCLFLYGASGQVTPYSKHATLNLTVTDAIGNRVPRAQIIVERNAQRCRFQCGSNGTVQIRVPPGEYAITIKADGFVILKVTGMVLRADEVSDQKFSLKASKCFDCYGLVAESRSPVIYEYDDPDIKPPMIVERPEPQYTEMAKQHNAKGIVVLRVVLNASGSVSKVVPVKSLPYGLTKSAVKAAQQITFHPAVFENRPVSSFFELNYEFSPHNAECHFSDE